jgi:hypothetical protein
VFKFEIWLVEQSYISKCHGRSHRSKRNIKCACNSSFRQHNVHTSQRSCRYNKALVFKTVCSSCHTWTNCMEFSPSWEADSSPVTTKIPACFGTRRFITVFTKGCRFSLPWDGLNSPQVLLYDVKIKCIIIIIIIIIIITFVSSFCNWCLSLRSSHKTPGCISVHPLRTTGPAHPFYVMLKH